MLCYVMLCYVVMLLCSVLFYSILLCFILLHSIRSYDISYHMTSYHIISDYIYLLLFFSHCDEAYALSLRFVSAADFYRVVLTAIDDSEPTSYINAVHIPVST